jgi:hypothetical protein
MRQVPDDGTNEDLDQRNRDAEPDADQRGHEGQQDPDERDPVDVHPYTSSTVPAGGVGAASTGCCQVEAISPGLRAIQGAGLIAPRREHSASWEELVVGYTSWPLTHDRP